MVIFQRPVFVNINSASLGYSDAVDPIMCVHVHYLAEGSSSDYRLTTGVNTFAQKRGPFPQSLRVFHYIHVASLV